PPDVTQWLGFDGVSSVERRHALDLEHNAQFHLESAHHYLVYGAAFTTFLKKGVGFEAAARFNVAYYISRWERWTDPAYAPAVIVLLSAYDPCWTASPEDGIKPPVLRANVLVRAVVVPAGQHTVSFRYRTPLLTAGAGVSLLGCAICVAMLLQAGRHARRHQFIS